MRKLVSYIRKSQRTNVRYFTFEESRETVSSQFGMALEREERPPYKFSSGAVYVGQ